MDLAALALFRPDQMLRRHISTAKRTMTRKAAKKQLTKEARLENAPYGKGFCEMILIGCFHMSGLFVQLL